MREITVNYLILDEDEERLKRITEEYKKKGYKIPNLTLKHNLFNQNVLLLPENKLYEYYCCYKKKDGMKLKFFKKFAPKRKDKALNFIEKENEMLNNKITKTII